MHLINTYQFKCVELMQDLVTQSKKVFSVNCSETEFIWLYEEQSLHLHFKCGACHRDPN